MIRPELKVALRRWREVIAAVGLALFGAWLIALGGWLLGPLGIGLVLLAAAWGLVALRRLRFLRGISAPGVVEVIEGQVGYYGPSFGGFVALADVTELRVIDLAGKRQWRLRTRGAEVLMIPVDAAGADRLYDAFAALPGIDMAAVTAALDDTAPPLRLWKRADPTLPHH